MEVAEKELQNTYKLKEGVQVLDFHTSHEEKQYLLELDTERFEINKGMADLIRLLQKDLPLEILAKEYAALKGVNCSLNEFSWILDQYLRPHGILQDETIGVKDKSLLSNYVYWKHDLLKSETAAPLIKQLSFLYHPMVLKVLFPALVLLHVYYFYFVQTVDFSITNIPITSLALLYLLYMISFLFHEIGHATASHRYGAKFGNIGYGFYLYFPILYADVTDVWKLTRIQRTIVDLGGIYFHLIFSAFLIGISFYYPNNFLSYLISLVSLAIVFNFNPFFRFDGYWIYSDLIGVPNLRERSWELVKYYYDKWTGKKTETTPYLFRIQKKEKILLAVYALLSNVFFIYIFYKIPQILIGLILAYPALLATTISKLNATLTEGDWVGTSYAIGEILTPSFFIFVLFFLIYNMGKAYLKPFWNKKNRKVLKEAL
ncbi:MAG: hypothetical protein AB8G15_00700 [Saprospiraceae bacterium]